MGGSEESDCVCRGGRCPRMWDCPFWVDRRRAEAKGSSAHVSTLCCTPKYCNSSTRSLPHCEFRQSLVVGALPMKNDQKCGARQVRNTRIPTLEWRMQVCEKATKVVVATTICSSRLKRAPARFSCARLAFHAPWSCRWP